MNDTYENKQYSNRNDRKERSNVKEVNENCN